MLPLFLMVKVTVTGRPVLVPAGPHRCPCMTDTQREDNAVLWPTANDSHQIPILTDACLHWATVKLTQGSLHWF